MTTGTTRVVSIKFGQVETIVGQPMDGKATRIALLLDHEQQRLPPSVGPLHQQSSHSAGKIATVRYFFDADGFIIAP